MGRIIGIVLIAALLGFGAYKIFSSSVDRSNSDEVGKAFLKALKKEDLSRAKKYVLEDSADSWAAAAKDKLSGMKSNGMDIFRAAIPDEPTFTTVPSAKGAPATDKTVKAGETTVTMRQVDGKWYVVSCNQP